MERPIGLMLLIAVMAVFLDIYWLAGIMVVGIVLIVIATFEPKRAVPAGGKDEQVLTPVVMQDIGEPPYLYPPNFSMKINPSDSLMPHYDIAGQSASKLFRLFHRTAKGSPYQSRKKVRWRMGPGSGPKGA